MKLEALIVPMILDKKDYEGGLDQATQEGRDAVALLTDKIGSGMQRAGVAIGAAGIPFVLFARSAIGASSDLEESTNAVNVVFGNSADVITKWGENASTQAGLSNSAFQQMGAETGALLINLGLDQAQAAAETVNLTQRAADMASIFNTDVDQALAAIQSGLRGQSEPLLAFGVDMRQTAVAAYALEQGLIGPGEEMDANTLALARMGLLMQQTDAIAGDFVNTSDGLANSQRIMQADFENLKAELGDELQPVMMELLAVGRKLITWFSEMSPEGKKLTSIVVVLGASLVILGPAISAVGALLGAMATISIATGVAVGTLVSGLLIIVGVVAAVIVIGVLLYKNWDKIKAGALVLKDKLIAIWESIKAGIKRAIDGIKGFFANLIPDIKMPEWIKNFLPGSPTPFEMGIRGIDKAVTDLNLQHSLVPSGGEVAPQGNDNSTLERLIRGLPQEIAMALRIERQTAPSR